MNLGIIRFILARILWMLAGLLVIPFGISFIYAEDLKVKLAIFFTIFLSLILGTIISIKKVNNKKIYAREGIILCALSWLILSLFGALPFFFSGSIPNLIDAFFETASGFTTTGASILHDIESLPHSLLFWRSQTHFVGGMGVLVFVLAILPKTKSDSSNVHILKAEMPGPTFGKLLPKITDFSRILYIIYISLTVLIILALLLAGMNIFDSFIHAFGVAGTGGFSNYNNGVAHFNSSTIEIILMIGMLVFGVNFNLYFFLVIKQFRSFFKDAELKSYILIFLSSVLLISTQLVSHYNNYFLLLKDVSFTVSSVITTTGFSTVDFNQWPNFSKSLLLLLMFFGASAGSTAGGFKIIRILTLFKTLKATILRTLSPNRIIPININNKSMNKDELIRLQGYFFLYIAIFTFSVLIVSISVEDFISAFSAVATSLNNIGPGLGIFGPTANFASLTNFNKLYLSLLMIAGRLELLPIILLFTPRTWKKG